jgi:hypothetical protein
MVFSIMKRSFSFLVSGFSFCRSTQIRETSN